MDTLQTISREGIMAEKGTTLVNKITRRECLVVEENAFGGVYVQYEASLRCPRYSTWHRRTDLITREEADAQKSVFHAAAS
jgi:hypothetical protein